MTIATKPASDLVVHPSLVRALLQEQHPDLAHLVLVKVAEGSDNAIVRLGDELAADLPLAGVCIHRALARDALCSAAQWTFATLLPWHRG
jgi:hypothetical protein